MWAGPQAEFQRARKISPVTSVPPVVKHSSHRSELAAFFLSSGFYLDIALHLFPCRVLLIHPGLGDPHGQRSHTRNHADTLGHRNSTPRIENVEVMRAFQAQLVGPQ